MLESQDLRGSLAPPDEDQVAFAIGRRCVDRDAERIRKGRRTSIRFGDCHMWNADKTKSRKYKSEKLNYSCLTTTRNVASCIITHEMSMLQKPLSSIWKK